MDGIQKYDDNKELVLLLVDLLYKMNDADEAISILKNALQKDSTNYIYPYTIGLLHQKREEYKQAIDAFKTALLLPSDTVKLYTNIGICYYNMGAEIEEKVRTISNNYRYLEEKEKSAKSFISATKWFEKAYEMDKNNQEVISRLKLLYIVLDNREKLYKLE